MQLIHATIQCESNLANQLVALCSILGVRLYSL